MNSCSQIDHSLLRPFGRSIANHQVTSSRLGYHHETDGILAPIDPNPFPPLQSQPPQASIRICRSDSRPAGRTGLAFGSCSSRSMAAVFPHVGCGRETLSSISCSFSTSCCRLRRQSCSARITFACSSILIVLDRVPPFRLLLSHSSAKNRC
jgi:hypothetical protein